MNAKSILKELDRIDDLPTLPAIVLEVNRMLQDYDTPMETLAHTIEKDQAMVPKILRLVNSAFFGLSSKISNIPRAISILGFNTVRNAIVSISIIEAFSVKGCPGNFNLKKFWSHSISVAVASKHLAQQTGFSAPEEAFTAGLLHDIGKIVLLLYFRDLFDQAWTFVQSGKIRFCDAEKAHLPITHALTGSYLAEKWQFPGNLVDVIRYHHGVRKNVADYDLLLIVHAADEIVNSKGEKNDNQTIVHGQSGLAQKIEMELKSIEEWYPETCDEIQLACQSFLEE